MTEFIYLNDPIICSVDLNVAPQTNCTYKVYIKDINSPNDWELIYTGSLYYIKPCNIVLNDILQSYTNDFYWFDNKYYSDRPSKADYTHMYFNIKVDVTYTIGAQSYFIYNIFNGYRSPNMPVIKAFDPTSKVVLYPSYRYGYNVRPRIPALNAYDASPFRFPCYVFKNNTVSSISLGIYRDGFPESVINPDYNSQSSNWSPLADTSLSFDTISLVTGDKASIGVSNGEKYVILCDVDNKPADYYLLWVNRLGAAQCQPFCKKSILKESVKTNYLTRINSSISPISLQSLNAQSPYNKTVEYTWTLNSHWLTYDEYNEFESLMTSKNVYLFDYKTNMMHEVVVSNSAWEYKDSNNTRRPFNLTIDVKKASTDNIVY